MSPNVTRKSVSGNVWCGSCHSVQPAQLHSYRQHQNLMIVSGACAVCDGPVCKISTIKSSSTPIGEAASPSIQLSTQQHSLLPLLGLCLLLSVILFVQAAVF